MNVVYSKKTKALIYSGTKASSANWDKHWRKDLTSNFKINSFVIQETKKYLDLGSRIIEGGCGAGDKVYSLEMAGFPTVGVDYAKETIKFLRENSELNVVLGDIRSLQFQDESFDGYWSLGVIEHFPDGIDKAVLEIRRVLKKDGYLFITVPSLTLLRRLKVFFNFYSLGEVNDDFYQYVYSPQYLINFFKKNGFSLVQSRNMDGLKGLKDELSFKFLNRVYNSNFIFSRIVKKIINISLSWFSGHITYFVFKKTSIESN